ncbi:pheromone A receptor-domain-containing protein [Vararia minispora EC-137]|uniref:Pheromone A receptor-domain-containing protein n=1 Tax=Vararia minispora EC-137 TaxID=1314806 RepID=A0ACB8Q6V1_9AGAM|nr:pheromone A receptor-domain-containing protein [Vararia minispora EC-137]
MTEDGLNDSTDIFDSTIAGESATWSPMRLSDIFDFTKPLWAERFSAHPLRNLAAEEALYDLADMADRATLFLAFWLFWELLTNGINAVLWADSADIKLYVYCDIVSHLQIVTGVIKSTCSFIITRRLYKTVVRQTIGPLNKREKLIDFFVEWGLGLILPLLVAGPLYYTIQAARFQVLEGYGCTNLPTLCGLDIPSMEFWTVLLPLVSVSLYSPRIAWTFYRHNKELNRFLQSNGSVTQDRFLRALAIACIDLLFTLPFGLIIIVAAILKYRETHGTPLPFYQGWSKIHADWTVRTTTYAEVQAQGTWSLISYYFPRWGSVILASVIIALFGFTEEVRATYWHGMCYLGKLVGRKSLRRQIEPMTFHREFVECSTVDNENSPWPSESFLTAPMEAYIARLEKDPEKTMPNVAANRESSEPSLSLRLLDTKRNADQADASRST